MMFVKSSAKILLLTKKKKTIAAMSNSCFCLDETLKIIWNILWNYKFNRFVSVFYVLHRNSSFHVDQAKIMVAIGNSCSWLGRIFFNFSETTISYCKWYMWCPRFNFVPVRNRCVSETTNFIEQNHCLNNHVRDSGSGEPLDLNNKEFYLIYYRRCRYLE